MDWSRSGGLSKAALVAAGSAACAWVAWRYARRSESDCGGGQAPPYHGLTLVQSIPLGPEVGGRLDHLTFDAKRNRIFVAALGDDSVVCVDAYRGTVHRRLSQGISTPQGVLYVREVDVLFVANKYGGTVTAFAGGSLMLIGTIHVGADVDNLRWDPVRNLVLVGGGGEDGNPAWLRCIEPRERHCTHHYHHLALPLSAAPRR